MSDNTISKLTLRYHLNTLYHFPLGHKNIWKSTFAGLRGVASKSGEICNTVKKVFCAVE